MLKPMGMEEMDETISRLRKILISLSEETGLINLVECC